MTIMRNSIVLVAFLAIAGTLASSADPHKVSAKSDAEILAIVMAIDEHEIHAAATAEEKHVGEPVLGYAQALHQDHKKNLDETRDLSTKIGVKPKDTPAVVQMRAKEKEELAKLMPLTGEAFEREFVSAMRAGHRDAAERGDALAGGGEPAAVVAAPLGCWSNRAMYSGAIGCPDPRARRTRSRPLSYCPSASM